MVNDLLLSNIGAFLARPPTHRTAGPVARPWRCAAFPAPSSSRPLQCRATSPLHCSDPLYLRGGPPRPLDLEASAARLARAALRRISARTQYPSSPDVLHHRLPGGA